MQRIRQGWLAGLCLLAGCAVKYAKEPQTFTPRERPVETAAVALPDGYKIEVVARGLTYPSGLTFDENGTPYVIEAGYSYGEDFTTPRLIRIGQNGQKQTVAEGEKNGPWTGVAYRDGNFFIAEGGAMAGGRIVRYDRSGNRKVLVANLPSKGDHHTNGPAIGPDGSVYFAVGTATNSGVVGPDNAKMGWLKREPTFHDIPCQDVVLTGENFTSSHALASGKTTTGAFSPYGTTTQSGQTIKGRIPCSGGVFRVSPEGGEPELVAWGFRNPYGLNWHGNALYVTDNGYDDRGSRPMYAAPDLLWKVERGRWYGWPDYAGDFRLQPKRKILARDPGKPPVPVARFGCHASAVGHDRAGDRFGFAGQIFVAQFGDQAPEVGKVYQHVGYKVVRVDPATGVITDFAVNKGPRNLPASANESGGLERPIDVKFSPDGSAMYIVDYGIMKVTKAGMAPRKETGVVWRVTRK